MDISVSINGEAFDQMRTKLNQLKFSFAALGKG